MAAYVDGRRVRRSRLAYSRAAGYATGHRPKALDYDNPELVQSTDNPLKKYVARAGMLCKDESFQSFLGAQNVEQAAMAMKAELQIESRAELSDPYKKEARQRLDNLVDRFKEWKSLMTNLETDVAYFTPKELSVRWRIHEKTIHNMAKDGRLDSLTIANRLRIPKYAVLEMELGVSSWNQICQKKNNLAPQVQRAGR